MSGLPLLRRFPTSFSSRNGRYKYCEGLPTPQSLLLGDFMQDREDESHPKLFKLPEKVLANTIDLLEDDKKTLASLALVDRVCLRLARACQFKEMHFDYSPQSHELLWHMAAEPLDDKNKTKRLFPIGVFVRKFTFAPLVDFFSTIHPELFNAIYIDITNKSPPPPQPQEIIDELLITAQEHYVNQRKLLFTVIAPKMPNLVVLVWKDMIQLDSDFIEAICRCSAKYVKLERIQISKHWPTEPPPTLVQWNLKFLDLNVNLMTSAYASGVDAVLGDPPTMAMNHPTSVFLNTLFQRCSSTLESLNWWHTGRLKDGLRVTLDHSKLTVPELQHIGLERLFFDPESFSSFTRPSLRHLELPGKSYDLISEILEACKSLLYLQTLVVPEIPPTRDKCMPIAKFIKRHNRVQKLHLGEEHNFDIEDDQLSSRIIPILVEGGFNDLRCLSLSWSGERLPYDSKVCEDNFPEISLVAFGTIGSLEQLSLRFGGSNNWLINHDKLRQHLRSLNRLKMLALLHDTYYRPELKYINPANYYYRRFVMESDHMDADARLGHDADEDDRLGPDETMEYPPVISIHSNVDGDEYVSFDYRIPDRRTWERAHRNRMLIQAEAYAEVLPELGWVYCGQRPMGLRPHLGEDGVVRKEAIPLSKQRATCGAFLSKTFGIER